MVPSKLWPTMPSEIMRLENLHGYLKFPGPLPVASIRLKYVARKEAAARFVPREEDGAAPAPDDGGMPISEKGTGIDVVEDGAAEPEERAPEPLPLQGELDLALGGGEPDGGTTDGGTEETDIPPLPEFETVREPPPGPEPLPEDAGSEPPAAQPPAAPADWG